MNYVGMSNFVKMSDGIPRLVLLIMKYIFRWAIYNNETPYQGKSVISIKSQINGVMEASNWFLSDAEIPGREGITVAQAFSRIGQYMQELRLSNLPPECSISTIKLDKTLLSSDANEIITFLQDYSYLIKREERKDKNLTKEDLTFSISGLLAPQWDLALSTRGVLTLDEKKLDLIFDNEEDANEKYREFINGVNRKYNAPFSKASKRRTIKKRKNKGNTNQQELF
jgi:hypothetical protein